MKRIADYFGLKPQVFTSWLTVLANLRNMCCHHARIWNRDFMLNPAEPRKMSNTWIDTSGIEKNGFFTGCVLSDTSLHPFLQITTSMKRLLVY